MPVGECDGGVPDNGIGVVWNFGVLRAAPVNDGLIDPAARLDIVLRGVILGWFINIGDENADSLRCSVSGDRIPAIRAGPECLKAGWRDEPLWRQKTRRIREGIAPAEGVRPTGESVRLTEIR